MGIQKKIQKVKRHERSRSKKAELISAKGSILFCANEVYLDDILFSDFYTINDGDKTELGQLVYLGKTLQNKQAIVKVAKIVRSSIMDIIEKNGIIFVCFIPPTVERNVQFMEVFKKDLQLDLKEIKVLKVSGLTNVPQKTLRKPEDRIINAVNTIIVDPNQIIDGNVLIIDDVVESGTTLNETAHQILELAERKIQIVGYSVVGNLKWVDAMGEV